MQTGIWANVGDSIVYERTGKQEYAVEMPLSDDDPHRFTVGWLYCEYRKSLGNPRYVGHIPGGYEWHFQFHDDDDIDNRPYLQPCNTMKEQKAQIERMLATK